MKKHTIKKTICAALAAVIAVMASGCGEVSETGAASRDTTASQAASSPSGEDTADITEPVSDKADEAEDTAEDTPEVGAEEGSSMIGYDGDFIASYNSFCAEILKNSCLEDIKKGENVMISPESVTFALSMLANGAGGDTLAEIEAVLGGMPVDAQNEGLHALLNRAESSKDVDFHIANSFWCDDGLMPYIKQDFIDTVEKFYSAEVFSVPISKDPNTCAGKMNGWVNDNTKGMIPRIIDQVTPNDRMFLINAMAFEGKWEEGYEDKKINRDGEFTAFDGTVENCVMLSSKENTYIECEGATGFAKYYQGGEYAFVGLLPDEDMTVADFVSSLDGEKIAQLWEERKTSEKVSVFMPEFSSDFDIEMTNILYDMGMKKAFEMEACDLSNLFEGDADLSVSRVVHRTHIEVDREGTRAAAASAVGIQTNGIDVVEYMVRLDRPFVYMIVDTENGAPIFIGAVNSLEKK